MARSYPFRMRSCCSAVALARSVSPSVGWYIFPRNSVSSAAGKQVESPELSGASPGPRLLPGLGEFAALLFVSERPEGVFTEWSTLTSPALWIAPRRST